MEPTIPIVTTVRRDARVRQVSNDGKRVQVHYVGFDGSWNEWIASSSRRLRPRRRARVDSSALWLKK